VTVRLNAGIGELVEEVVTTQTRFRGSAQTTEQCFRLVEPEVISLFFSLVIPFYLQSVQVHSADCVKIVHIGL
jgi:hypothetical protein